MQRSLALVFALVLAACGGAAPPTPSDAGSPAVPRLDRQPRPRPEVPRFDSPDGGADGG